MDKKIDCIALEPLKVGTATVVPGKPLQLSEAEYAEQAAAGRVALDRGAAFTPADASEGVATVAADPDPTDDDAFADPLEGKDTEAVAGESAGDAAQKAAPAASDPPAVRGKKKAR